MSDKAATTLYLQNHGWVWTADGWMLPRSSMPPMADVVALALAKLIEEDEA